MIRYIEELMLRRANIKEALCEFALSTGVSLDEVCLVEKDVSQGTTIKYEYSIQKRDAMNDYEDMRKFQEKYINSDQRLRSLIKAIQEALPYMNDVPAKQRLLGLIRTEDF
jgi:hypothetical protein